MTQPEDPMTDREMINALHAAIIDTNAAVRAMEANIDKLITHGHQVLALVQETHAIVRAHIDDPDAHA